MRLSALEAHAICAAMVLADQVVRGLRIRWLFGGVGVPLRLRHAIELNLVGDAASAVTPLRLGGEPARVGMLRSRGVPTAASLVAISFEVLIMWPMLITAGGLLLWWLGPAWWADAGGRFVAELRDLWVWVLVLVAAGLLAWRVARRHARLGAGVRRQARRAAVYGRRMPAWPLAGGALLTAINMALRLAILPVLALTLPAPPRPETMLVGSFGLTYGQMVMPTPSGLGAVELGFLAGVAGPLGGGVLLAWRAWTLLIPGGVGAVLALRRFGRGALRALGPRD